MHLLALNHNIKLYISLCQKAVHRSGTDVVKIKHQNCLLQVNHVKVVFEDYIFTYKKMVLNFYALHNIKIAKPSDLVNHHTRHKVCNSTAANNCFWALLKLFVGSIVYNN